MRLLKKIESVSDTLSCRDWCTADMLREKGFCTEMHGCPAWYDLKYIDKTNISFPKDIKKICISDPKDPWHERAGIEVVEWVKKRFSNAEIIFVYHRGIEENTRLESYLKQEHISYVDISDDYKGFSIYDECQLHVGFRVHAHIYNLSHRKLSLLIEEDGRGAGVNETLGFKSIHAYSDETWAKSRIGKK